MLNNHPNLSVGPETFFLSSLLDIERVRLNQLALYGINQAQWHDHMRELFSWVHSQRAEREGKSRWVDKTPGYALILDFIDQLYPDSQIIHIVRNPYDVIDSWRRRLGAVQAHQAVKAWPQHVLAARAFRDKHTAERFTEIRYEELVANSKEVMVPLIEWLGEEWDDRILELPKSNRSENSGEDHRQQRWERWLGTSENAGQASKPAWKRVESPRNTSEISSGSVGVGMRGRSKLVNAPYFLELELKSRALVRELGYS